MYRRPIPGYAFEIRGKKNSITKGDEESDMGGGSLQFASIPWKRRSFRKTQEAPGGGEGDEGCLSSAIFEVCSTAQNIKRKC